MTGVRGFWERVYTVPKSTLKYENFITIEQTSGCMYSERLGMDDIRFETFPFERLLGSRPS